MDEKARENKQMVYVGFMDWVYVGFMDWEKANDLVHREALWQLLRMYNVVVNF